MRTKTYTFRRVFNPVERWIAGVLAWTAGITGGAGCLGFVLAIFSMVPAWITHVVVCIKAHDILFLLVGGFFFPVGVIHGWGVWFGWWG